MSDCEDEPFTYDFLVTCDREHDYPDDVLFDDGLHEMTEEEWSIYAKQVRESGGSDIDPMPIVFAIGIIVPPSIYQDPELLHRCINLAIEDYCKKNNGKKLKLKEPVKWNLQALCRMNYYITFTAEDEETREVETYQAKVRDIC